MRGLSRDRATACRLPGACRCAGAGGARVFPRRRVAVLAEGGEVDRRVEGAAEGGLETGFGAREHVFAKAREGVGRKSARRAWPARAARVRSGAMAHEFTHRIRVRYAECDPQGVVFNANYYAYYDLL